MKVNQQVISLKSAVPLTYYAIYVSDQPYIKGNGYEFGKILLAVGLRGERISDKQAKELINWGVWYTWAPMSKQSVAIHTENKLEKECYCIFINKGEWIVKDYSPKFSEKS